MYQNLILGAAFLAVGTAALSEPVPFDAMRESLFDPEGAEVAVFPDSGLTPEDRQRISLVGSQQPYYGAFAISPDQGLLSEATAATANHHSAEAAAKAAVAECNGKRASGTRNCVVAAHIRPKGWTGRSMQVSQTGTAALETTYADAPLPKAFAMSPSTGAWSIMSGPAALNEAMADCAAKASAPDCVLAVAD